VPELGDRSMKTCVWFAPAVLAIPLVCSQAGQATELAGSLGMVAALHAEAGSRVAQPRPSPRSVRGEVIVRREAEGSQFGEAAAVSWRYPGRWATGLILGAGF
jgi:hypothetical protein